MQQGLFRKALVYGILILFVVISTMPLADCSMLGDPGISLITIKVMGEMGENGWYVSDVPFSISYESDEIVSVYYGINGVWTEYSEPFIVSEDGDDIAVEWYAVDHKGNQSEVDGPFLFDLDQTLPKVPLGVLWEAFQDPPGSGKWYVRLWVKCTDAMSGMDRVEWAINDKVRYIVKGSGPVYEWIIEWYDFYKSFITATAYDKAGNSDYTSVFGSCPLGGLESPMFSTGIVKEDNQQNSQSSVSTIEIVGREKPQPVCSMSDEFDPSYIIVVFNREMGNNDWIVSDVNITIISDPEGVESVYYKLDDGEWTLYTDFVVISGDLGHKFSWYIIDLEGYSSTPDSISFKIDQTLPEITLTRRRIGIDKMKFTAFVYDVTSGVDRVEFYVGYTLEQTVTSPPYEWVWTGHFWGFSQVKATVYDKAGNSASDKVGIKVYSQGQSLLQNYQNGQVSNSQQSSTRYSFQTMVNVGR